MHIYTNTHVHAHTSMNMNSSHTARQWPRSASSTATSTSANGGAEPDPAAGGCNAPSSHQEGKRAPPMSRHGGGCSATSRGGGHACRQPARHIANGARHAACANQVNPACTMTNVDIVTRVKWLAPIQQHARTPWSAPDLACADLVACADPVSVPAMGKCSAPTSLACACPMACDVAAGPEARS